jgi:hypothetical protein
MALKLLGEADLQQVREAITLYPFNPCRQYRSISKPTLAEALYREIEGLVRGGKARVMALEGPPQVIVVLEELPWDGAIFGLRMGRIGYILHHGRIDLSSLTQGLMEVVDYVITQGLDHLSVSVDAADVWSLQALEHCGFRVMDSLLTGLFQKSGSHLRPAKTIGHVRPYQHEDLAGVMAVAEEAFSTYTGRFHHDPALSHAAAQKVYLAWTENLCRQRATSKVVVAERQGKIVGFLAYQRLEVLSQTTGLRHFGRGIGGVSRKGVGAFVGLQREVILQGEVPDTLEVETSWRNVQVIRILNYLGLEYIRSRYQLHLCLPQTPKVGFAPG